MLKIGSIGLSFMYNLITGNVEEKSDEKQDCNNTLQTNFKRLHILRETLEQHGGLFSKVAQMLSYGDCNSSVFSECKPFSRDKTIQYIQNEENNDYTVNYDVYKTSLFHIVAESEIDKFMLSEIASNNAVLTSVSNTPLTYIAYNQF